MNYKQIVKLLLFSLAFSPIVSSAQNNAKIKVEAVVRTPDGEPIAGAVINGNDRETYAITSGGRFIRCRYDCWLCICC